jgi:hypothetical protein
MGDYDHLTPSNTKAVMVRWEDIVALDNWNVEDVIQPIEVATLGWLLEDSPNQMVIASSYNWKDSEWASFHAFPKMKPTYEPIYSWEAAAPMFADLDDEDDEDV